MSRAAGDEATRPETAEPISPEVFEELQVALVEIFESSMPAAPEIEPFSSLRAPATVFSVVVSVLRSPSLA